MGEGGEGRPCSAPGWEAPLLGAVSEITCVSLEIFGGNHDHKANGTLVSEHLVGPPADGAHALDGGDAVVGDQDLRGQRQGGERSKRGGQGS